LPVCVKQKLFFFTQSSGDPYSGFMRPAIPRDLPLLTKADWLVLIPSLSRANRSLAEYNGMLRRLPNSDLLLSPLRLQEAVLSSRIEGTLATMSEVLQFEAGEPPEREARRHDIEEILNYRIAVDAAVEELKTRPFSLNLLLRLHRLLSSSVRGENKAPGKFRRQQNYIGSRIGGVETIRFTPPDWMKLEHSLSNWEKYYHSEEEPLVRLACIHAQFEFLHPFLDGNGRIGRMLIPIFLFEKGLLSQPSFYLSEYIEAHRDEYIDRLSELGRARYAWRNWTEFFLHAVTAQAQQNATKADAILALYEGLKERFLSATNSRYAVPLLDAVFKQPYFQTGQLVWKGEPPSKPTLATMLQALEKAKVIVAYRSSAGRRPAIWWMPDSIEIIERRA
jgi:Fic family protein